MVRYEKIFAAYLDAVRADVPPAGFRESWRPVWGLDLGVGANLVAVLTWWGPDGQFYASSEVVGEDGGLWEVLSQMRELTPAEGTPVRMGMDGLGRSVTDGQRPIDVLSASRWKACVVPSSFRKRLMLVRSLICVDAWQCDLRIAWSCSRLLDDLGGLTVRSEPGGGLLAVEHGRSHSVDALGYSLAAEWACVGLAKEGV